MPELHCSACDAIVPAGSTTCPGCGLTLTATAAPAVYVEGPRFSLWKVLLLGAAALLIALEIFGRR